MKATAPLPGRAPAATFARVAEALADLAFARRLARVGRLRRAGRHREADRVLRALQREIEGRHGRGRGRGAARARP